MLCTEATFVKTNSCLVVRLVSFDAAGLHLLTFGFLEPYTSKDIELDLKSCYRRVTRARGGGGGFPLPFF